MTPTPAACDRQLLRLSLDDSLSEQQEDLLAAHLEDCESCQLTLAAMASDTLGWSRVSTALREEISGAQPLGRGMISTLIPANPSPAQTNAPTGSGHFSGWDVLPADFAVDFLEPAREADSLGRLQDIEIRSVIGHGGNGIVLKGYQQELNRLVAVKVMAPQLAANAAARKRFAREAQATAAIVHPNVMPILTVHSSNQLPYLVMPYVDCESLQERLDREGPLPTLDVLRIAHQVARGLAAAHSQGLVHRDVKPANILLERNVDRVMLTDFGLARAIDDATLTGTGLIAGTPQYMSPEQARGDSVNLPSDLFSLGSVMYAMCTGRPPFRAQTSYGILRRVIEDTPRPVGELNADVPAWLEGLINGLLGKQSETRLGDAAVIATMLQSCIAHVQQPQSNPLPDRIRSLAPQRARPRTAWRRLVPDGSRYRLPLMAILSAAVLGTLALVAIPPRSSPPGERSAETTDQRPLGGSAADVGKSSPTAPGSWEDGLDDELSTLTLKIDQLLESIEATADVAAESQP